MDADRLLDGRLKIRHLTLIVALADCQGVMRAAELLRLPQPAVTRGLKEVETILGCLLFERHPRGIVPTSEGVAFVDHARALVGQLRQASRHVAEVAAGERGSVAVGTHLSGSDRLLARAVLRLKERSPQVDVTLVEKDPDDLQRRLISGEIDLIVGRLDIPSHGLLNQTPLYIEPIDLVVRAEHPAAQLSPLSLEALREYPWILPPTDSTLGRAIRSVFAIAGLALPANRTVCSSLSTPRTLILESDSIAPLPTHMAMDDGHLRILRSPEVTMVRPIGIMQLADRPTTVTVLHMTACLQETAAEVSKLLERRVD